MDRSVSGEKRMLMVYLRIVCECCVSCENWLSFKPVPTGVSIPDYTGIIHRKNTVHKPKAPDFSRAFG
jgi:hypothetical protein